MISQISPQDAKKMLLEGNAILLDVRHKEEVEFTSLKPHIWIEMSQIASRMQELPKDKQIICICRTGSRSATAAYFLQSNGFDAVNLRGGIFEWSKIDPTLKKYFYEFDEEKLVVKEI